MYRPLQHLTADLFMQLEKRMECVVLVAIAVGSVRSNAVTVHVGQPASLGLNDAVNSLHCIHTCEKQPQVEVLINSHYSTMF